MIFITGNAGYIGSSLSLSFPEANGCDLGWFSESQNAVDFSNTLNLSNFSTIIHLAGHSSEPMAASDPDGAWENNVNKFKRLVENLHESQLLIYVSSASVYSKTTGAATEESHTSSSRPYDCTKIVCDAIAQMHMGQGKNIVGLRLGTVAGYSPIQRIDTVVNAMTLAATTNNQINCVNPSTRRTLLFLDDLDKAIAKIIDNPVPGIFNLGSVNTTVGEIAETVAALTGADIAKTHTGESFYDFHLDCTKFINAYGSFSNTSLEKVVIELQDTLPFTKHGRRDACPT